MSDQEERAMRYAREVASMTPEEKALELEAAGIDVEEERKRFLAWRASQQRRRYRKIVAIAAAALTLAALLVLLWISLKDEPQPVAPVPEIPAAPAEQDRPKAEPLRIVEKHEDLAPGQTDAGARQRNVPVAPNEQ
jgi:hypothetical protein